MTVGVRRGRAATVLLHGALLLVALLVLGPLAWMVVVSVSSLNDLTSIPLHWLPRTLDLSRYGRLLSFSTTGQGALFLASLRNTIIVAACTTALAFVIAIPASWVFSRIRGRHGALLYVIVATYMLPPVLFVVPLYRILAALDLLNTKLALVLVDLTIVLPFVTWLIKSGIDAIPAELEEAAAIDGAALWRTLLSVTLPLARPIIGTALLLAILIVWDEFLYALLFTSNQQSQTLTVALANLATGRILDNGLLATAGILGALPPILAGLFLQRTLVAGLTGGAVKG